MGDVNIATCARLCFKYWFASLWCMFRKFQFHGRRIDNLNKPTQVLSFFLFISIETEGDISPSDGSPQTRMFFGSKAESIRLRDK
jgi:hypothetical protein